MTDIALTDPDCGQLTWNPELDWWEGMLMLDSPRPFILYVFSRDVPDRQISGEARQALKRISGIEAPARAYAAAQLTAIYNQEWSDGQEITEQELARRLDTESVEIHETGYAEVHFLTVRISAAGACRVGKREEMPCDKVGAYVKELHAQPWCDINIEVDRESRYEFLERAVSSLHREGFEKVGFVNNYQ